MGKTCCGNPKDSVGAAT